MISPKTYFLSEDRQIVVEEGDARAKFLVVRAGQEINDALAEQYGITGGKVAAPASDLDSAAKSKAQKSPRKKPAK